MQSTHQATYPNNQPTPLPVQPAQTPVASAGFQWASSGGYAAPVAAAPMLPYSTTTSATTPMVKQYANEMTQASAPKVNTTITPNSPFGESQTMYQSAPSQADQSEISLADELSSIVNMLQEPPLPQFANEPAGDNRVVYQHPLFSHFHSAVTNFGAVQQIT